MNQANLFEMLGLTEEATPEAPFIPRRLKAVPDGIANFPEKTESERIAKVKAVLKWLMVNFPTSFSYSGGKDSSAVLGLAMAAAAELAAAGEKVKPFAVLNADTLVENPRVHAVTKGELAKLKAWIARHKLPGTVHVARPNLISQFAVSIIGQGSLPSTPETKRDCTVDWKSRPLSKLRKAVLGTNDVRSGRYVVSVTGVRYSESAARASSMTLRGESPLHVVQTNADGNVAIAPIATWSWDDVFMYLGMAANGLEHTFSDFMDVISVYREAMGECVINGSDDDVRASKPCSARTGCWTCLMVQDDKSMDKMLDEPENAYMRPLAKFRTFLSNTFYDLSRRSWLGTSIDAEGNMRFAPEGYSPEMVQELLRYALTIQVQECAEADRLRIAPRFRIIDARSLIAIDAMWSLNGLARPFTALKIYRDIIRGANYPVPDVPVFPKVPMPAPRKIYVGTDWDSDTTNRFTGLRDPIVESFGASCAGTREIQTKGVTRTVLDVNLDAMFSVDAEGAMMFFDFELDRLVDEWHGPNGFAVKDDRPMSGVAYRYYLQYGVISLAKNQVGKADEILRRSAFRERIGLAGHQDVQAAATAAPQSTSSEGAAPQKAPAMSQGELVLEAA